MGESRTELIQWINQLLELNYTKVEQCGTGAAYCQILDTIYHDVTMSKVKFNAKYGQFSRREVERKRDAS